jgi:integrase/recombinase XerC
MSLDPISHPATATMVEARDARVQRYLDHAQFEKRLAQRTLILYSLDLVRL